MKFESQPFRQTERPKVLHRRRRNIDVGQGDRLAGLAGPAT
jgi:hypothetical protein